MLTLLSGVAGSSTTNSAAVAATAAEGTLDPITVFSAGFIFVMY